MDNASPPGLPALPITLVRDLMTEVVETLRVGDSLNLADHLMKAGRIRHLPVVDEHERLVGLVTHRKILEVWASHGRPYHEQLDRIAAEIPIDMMMETNVLTVSPDTSAALAAGLLEASKFGCLPVLDHNKLVGIVTESDFVRFARKFFESQQRPCTLVAEVVPRQGCAHPCDACLPQEATAFASAANQWSSRSR